MQGQRVRQWLTWPFNDKSGFMLEGYSRSTDSTFFYIRQLGIGLDAGECRGLTPHAVFLTHGHTDHTSSLHYLCSRGKPGNVNTLQLCVPTELAPAVLPFLNATATLNAVNYPPPLWEGLTLIGMDPGEEVTIPAHPEWHVVSFQCVHMVPCIGYAFYHQVEKLLPELAGVPGREIKALRDAGMRVTAPVRQPKFAYAGDTDISVFSLNPWLADFPIVIVECTFLAERGDGLPDIPDLANRCREHGHIAWCNGADGLEHIADAHPRTTFVLIHFSTRYERAQVEAFFGARPQVRNVVPLFNDYKN